MRSTLWLGLFCSATIFVPVTASARGFDLESHLQVKASAWTGIVDIKLKTGMFFTIADGKVRENGTAVLDLAHTGAAAALALTKPLRHRFGEDIVALRQERELLEEKCHCNVPDLASWVSLDLRGFPLPIAKLIMAELNDLEIVEKVQARSRVYQAADISPVTSNYVGTQGHLEAAPGGIGALAVRSRPGSRGEGINVGDVENGWQLDHEDLPSCVKVKFDSTPYWGTDHGTAVLGEIFALENGYGVTGIAPQAKCHVSSHYDGQNLGWPEDPAAAIKALSDLFDPGDVIVIEIHVPGPNSPAVSDPSDPQKGFVPAEYEDPTYDAIRNATAKGIVVVSAAGNGGENLDAAAYGRKFDRTFRDSRAIMVGAGAPATGTGGAPRSRLSYSDYGTRVDVQGWGYDVVTIGYGDLFYPNSDKRQMYTAQFAGTSSATPIVSGAVAVVQGVRKAAGLSPMTGPQLAELFIRTGTPQAGSLTKHIGPLPDLEAALDGMYACGNGDVEPGEVCDDGNTDSGDGCSADCTSDESCGNHIIDGDEACDDGNHSNGDGCSATCVSDESCGNHIVDASEACDDGNHFNGDGCSATCASDESCGNHIVDTGETCDDGNTVGGDGCASDCLSSGGTGTPAGEPCGNSQIDFNEVCDDGNTVSGDGCASDCQSNEACGNGIQDVNEACDDGDNDSGDGCSGTCSLEKRCSDGVYRVTCPAKPGSTTGGGTVPTSSDPNATGSTVSTPKSGCAAVPASEMWVIVAAIALSMVRRRASH